MTSHIYVTGTSGVLGAEFAQQISNKTSRVVHSVSRKTPSAIITNSVTHHSCRSVFDANWFNPAHNNATLVHCAGLSDPRSEFADIEHLFDECVLPHFKMMESLVELGWRGRLLFTSSGGTVYGDPHELPIRESHATNPKSYYGLHKLMLEKGFSQLASRNGFELINLRVANPYGAKTVKKGQGVIPIIAEAYRERKMFQVFGDGTEQRDYIHVDDLSNAVEKAIDTKLTTSVATLNIGSGRGVALNTLIKQIGRSFERPLDTSYLPLSNNVTSNVLSIDLARKILGWSPRISFEDGIRKFVGTVNAHTS